MAWIDVGKDRFFRLFPANSTPGKRVLIKDVKDEGLLVDSFVRGTVIKVYPVQSSRRAGKLCKIVLKEDEKQDKTKTTQYATINAFLFADLAEEGYKLVEGDVVILAEIIVEPSPTDGHQFQLIADRTKTQVSLWVISCCGERKTVRINRGNKDRQRSCVATPKEEDGDVEKDSDVSTSLSDSEADESEELSHEDMSVEESEVEPLALETKPKPLKGRQLGPNKGITPLHADVLNNLVVLVEKENMAKLGSKVLSLRKSLSRSSEVNNIGGNQQINTRSGENSLVQRQTEDKVSRSTGISVMDHKSLAHKTDVENPNHLTIPLRSSVDQQASDDEKSTDSDIGTRSFVRRYNTRRSPLIKESSCQTPDEDKSPRTRHGWESRLDKSAKAQDLSGQESTVKDKSQRTRQYVNQTSRLHVNPAAQFSPGREADVEMSSPEAKQRPEMMCVGFEAGPWKTSTPHKSCGAGAGLNRLREKTALGVNISNVMASKPQDTVVSLYQSQVQHQGCDSTDVPYEEEVATLLQDASCNMELPESSKDAVTQTGAAVIPELFDGDIQDLGNQLETPSGTFSPVVRKRSLSSFQGHGEETSRNDGVPGEPSHKRPLLPSNYMNLTQVSSNTVPSSPLNELRCSPAKRTCIRWCPAEHRKQYESADPVATEQDKQDATHRLGSGSLIPRDYTTVASASSSTNSDHDTGVEQAAAHIDADDVRRPQATVSISQPGLSHLSHPTDGCDNQSDGILTNNRTKDAVYSVPTGYTKLINLQQGLVVNVFGVVKLFKPVWKCRGTDMCSVVVLVDPTVSGTLADGLECVLFQESAFRLPQVHEVGDIVRLHRVKIGWYQGRLQAKSSRGFSAVVFDGNTDLPVSEQTARVSSNTFTLSQAHKDTVEKLKKWCDANPDLLPSLPYFTVESISPDSNFNIVCQVKGMAAHRTMDSLVLFVADGTKPQYEIRKCDSDEYIMTVPLSNGTKQNDSIVCVFLYGPHAEAAKSVKAEVCLILHDVHAQMFKGGAKGSILDFVEPVLELCVHRSQSYGRGVTELPPDSPKVKLLMNRLHDTQQ